MTWTTPRLVQEGFRSQLNCIPASSSRGCDAGHDWPSEGPSWPVQGHPTNWARYELRILSLGFHHSEISNLWLARSLATFEQRLADPLSVVFPDSNSGGEVGPAISMKSLAGGCALLSLNGSSYLDGWPVSWYIDDSEQRSELLKTANNTGNWMGRSRIG